MRFCLLADTGFLAGFGLGIVLGVGGALGFARQQIYVLDGLRGHLRLEPLYNLRRGRSIGG